MIFGIVCMDIVDMMLVLGLTTRLVVLVKVSVFLIDYLLIFGMMCGFFIYGFTSTSVFCFLLVRCVHWDRLV